MMNECRVTVRSRHLADLLLFVFLGGTSLMHENHKKMKFFAK